MTTVDRDLLKTKLRRRHYVQPAAYSTDDARKLLEAGVEPRGGWCGPLFAASAISLLAIAAVLIRGLS